MKAKLQSGQPVIGFAVMGNWPEMVEMVGHLGADCVMFDGEHGILTLPDIAGLVRAAENVGITPVARVSRNAPDLILSFLDVGVQSIVIPRVNNRAEAVQAVRAVKYYPEGERGCGYGHMREWGISQPFTEYIADSNRETLVIAQCESKEGLENLAEIVTVPGVDMIMTGPLCLSQSLGIPGQIDHPMEVEALARIKETTHGAGKWLCGTGRNPEHARQLMGEGVNFVISGLHDVLIRAVREHLAIARSER
jgi:4-hydroxy-2-oxoheptanedioate aldolase